MTFRLPRRVVGLVKGVSKRLNISQTRVLEAAVMRHARELCL
jgi:hypothetical protein